MAWAVAGRMVCSFEGGWSGCCWCSLGRCDRMPLLTACPQASAANAAVAATLGGGKGGKWNKWDKWGGGGGAAGGGGRGAAGGRGRKGGRGAKAASEDKGARLVLQGRLGRVAAAARSTAASDAPRAGY